MLFNQEKEKIIYLLKFGLPGIVKTIDNVLNDSKIDPHYSAVAETNRIKCYIELMNALGENLPYRNVKEFFDFYGFTKEQYLFFEESRKKESKYYRGVQY